MFIADYKKHNLLVIEPGATAAKVFFHSDQFHQPNDLAIAADGTLFASDPRFPHSGQIWRIARGADGKASGQVMSSDRTMGATNGIDLSPDGRTLYVSEPDTREVWAYRLDGTKLTSPRLVKKFDAAELDGLRTDIDGKIYVARPLNGTIAVLAPDKPAESALVREILLRGKEPTNLTFGGPDGKSVFVTQRQGRFIEIVPRRQSGTRAMSASSWTLLGVRAGRAMNAGTGRLIVERLPAISHMRYAQRARPTSPLIPSRPLATLAA